MSPEFYHQPEKDVLSQEVVDIAAARFTDRLDTDHEQAWEELLALGKDTHMTVEDLMTPVWLEDSLPQAFRDRAMLLVVGSQNTRKALGLENRSTNGSFFYSGISVEGFEKNVEVFDPVLFHRWLQDAWRYQQETSLPIIIDQYYLTWHYELLSRGIISETELDDFVGKIDIRASSPEWDNSGWGSDAYPLRTNRFPLLSDILNTEIVGSSSEKVRTWALNHLMDWLCYQKGDTKEIPA